MKEKSHSIVKFVITFYLERVMNRHIASVHERKKPYLSANFATRSRMNIHIASVHERKMPFNCNIFQLLNLPQIYALIRCVGGVRQVDGADDGRGAHGQDQPENI